MKTKIETPEGKIVYEIGHSTQQALKKNNKIMLALIITLATLIICILLLLFNTGIIGNSLKKAIC